MTTSRVAVAAVVGLGLVALLAAASRVPWRPHPEQDAQLVLSWRGVSEATDLCREPTEEDLTGLPAHMRPDRICEEQLSAFRLSLSLDGVLLVDRTITPAGARGDRPLYVLERLDVGQGHHRLQIGFVPIPLDGADAAGTPGEAAGITLDQTVDFAPGRVVLVTRDGDRGGFVVRTANDRHAPTE